MPAATEEADLQTVRRRGDRSRAPRDGASRTDHDVLTKHDGRRGKASQQTVLDHGPRTLGGFLTRLEHGHQRATPVAAR
jgi:hypothetical protein